MNKLMIVCLMLAVLTTGCSRPSIPLPPGCKTHTAIAGENIYRAGSVALCIGTNGKYPICIDHKLTISGEPAYSLDGIFVSSALCGETVEILEVKEWKNF